LSRRKRCNAKARRVIPPLFGHGPADPELRPVLAITFETVKVRRIRSGAAVIQDEVSSCPLLIHWSKLMSIFGKIMGAIFGTKAEAAPAGGGTATSTGSSGSAAPGQTVDVAAIVDKAAAAKGEKLEWRTSIVDLMKALDIDSSFSARKELAKELGYTGDGNDSASMNIWLHKQVMTKLAANGGKLPPEIKH
jgi:Domain of unknown function (DUF3597)